MKKTTLTILLLILCTAIPVVAQNDKSNIDITKISMLNIEQDATVREDLKADIDAINPSNKNKVSVIVKHKVFKSSSRRLRVKNIVNFLNNSENKQCSVQVLC